MFKHFKMVYIMIKKNAYLFLQINKKAKINCFSSKLKIEKNLLKSKWFC